MIKKINSRSLLDTRAIAASIAELLVAPACVYLQGGLGAGKTTLCKGIIQELGYSGVVTSPTYNLIQEYKVKRGIVYHMDLYRLQDPDELEYLGLADLYTSDSFWLVEWPDKGSGYLPVATHKVNILDEGLAEVKEFTLSGFV